MTTFDAQDMKVAEELGGIMQATLGLTTTRSNMQAAWNKRVEQRDVERREIEARVKSLESTRSVQYGVFVGIGAVVTVIVEFVIKVVLK